MVNEKHDYVQMKTDQMIFELFDLNHGRFYDSAIKPIGRQLFF